MTLDSAEQVVTVKILDHEYQIRSDEEAKVRRVAEYLNRRIEEIKAGSRVLNRVDLLIMAAFMITSDFFSVQEELEDLKREVEDRAASLGARIEQNLAGQGVQTP